MIEEIVGLLQGDSQLAAILPGGVWRAVEISRQATPDAYDEWHELRPCALVKGEGQTPWGPHRDSSRLYVTVWFYQQGGYDAIEAARKRVYALLHKTRLTPAEGGCYEIVHVNDLIDQEDAALGVPMAMSRYMATVQRV